MKNINLSNLTNEEKKWVDYAVLFLLQSMERDNTGADIERGARNKAKKELKDILVKIEE